MRGTGKGGRRQAPISIHHEQNPEICEIPVRRAAPHSDWQFLKLPRRQVLNPSFRHQNMLQTCHHTTVTRTLDTSLAPLHAMKDAEISAPNRRPIIPSGSAPGTPGLVLKKKACVSCRARKVKCDRGTPCANCTRWSLTCVFPSPIRKCRRVRKAAELPTTSGTAVRNEDPPTEVAQQLEPTLRSMSTSIGKPRGVLEQDHNSVQLHQGDWDFFINSGSPETFQASVEKAAKFMSSRVHNVGSADAPVPSVFTRLSSDLGNLRPHSLQPFPISTFQLDVAPFHPSPPQVQRAWHTFLINIDPLVKILHRSTTERLLHKAVRHPTSLTNGETAVVFTVYFSSLSAMSDAEAEACFNIPKQQAQAVYRAGAEHALMLTDILTTKDLTTLQGFVLFLSLGRFTDDATRMWALTGLVRRLDAVTSASTSPFENEIRRRLRWELWYLDHRAHEDGGKGSAPSDTGGSPELPLNVKDKSLNPVTNVAPYPEAAWTEISFSLIRFEIARTARMIEFQPSIPQKLDMIDNCERRIASTYLCHCDDNHATHWLARHVSHVLIMELRFKLLRREPQSDFDLPDEHPIPQAVLYDLFQKAIDIVDTPRRIEVEPQAKHWSWLLAAYMQFQPLSFLLSELCYRQGSEEVERAWEIAERALLRRKENDTSKNMRILRQLMEKARLKRELRGSVHLDTGFFEVSQALSDSPSSGENALYTPTHQANAMLFSTNGISDLGPDSPWNLHFDEVPIATSACKDLAQDGVQLQAESTADIPPNLDFGDGYPFLDLEDLSIPSLMYSA